MSRNAILPPAIAMEETKELETFFLKDKKTCKDNPHCRCGRYAWCQGAHIVSTSDWRMEALSVAENTALAYKELQARDRKTIPVKR